MSFEKGEPIEDLVTWIYEQGSFSPNGKIEQGKAYSLVNDYLGTPILAYNEQGQQVWQRELDCYGRLRSGDNGFVPFLYQGQYFDEETQLAYNRFRYYSPDTGMYISQDPIGLAGNNPNLYGYVYDSNLEVDIFGLSHSPGDALLHNIIQQSSFGNTTVEMSGFHGYDDIMEAGSNFVGKNPTIETFPDGQIKSITSKDGLRRFRPPKFKHLQGYKQANFEMRTNTDISWKAHIKIDGGTQKVKNPHVSNMHVKCL